jgi:nicotinamide mononucleotide transporter
MDLTEVLGFVTGAWSVWLTVKQNIWNWPIGIANSVFYLWVFFQARLFADSSLQVIYVVLGFMGWYCWLRGGPQHSTLRVSRVSLRTSLALALVLVAGTLSMGAFLVNVHDASPHFDALTTVLSLIAQYMLTRKLIENWLVWITADVIYIGLYFSRELYLTSVLYAIFLTMCLMGLRQWRASLVVAEATAQLEVSVSAAV